PEPTETGMDWRTPVIEWISTRKTTKDEPLEKKLAEPSPKKDDKGKDEKDSDKDKKDKDDKAKDKKDLPGERKGQNK
ncbi:MAG TPA: hypothetical protein VLS89_15185, partial [Candidatus Nanopelagicales bacterium]|nr:hypothetical protein [Candidatus Nanopelagicales bacterium]